MNRTIVPPPVTLVMEVAEAWLPARMEAVEERLRRLAKGHGEGLAADAGATLAAGGKRLRPMLVLLSAGPGAGEVWSMTTSSTRRRFAAAARRWSRVPAATARWRSATCCSREPSPSWEETATESK